MLAGINSFSQFIQHIKIKSAEPSDKSGIKGSFTVLEGYIKTDSYIIIMGFPDIKYRKPQKGNTKRGYLIYIIRRASEI